MGVSEVSELYPLSWFSQDFEHLQPEFDVVADSLVRQFPRLASVFDVGCGPGMLLRRFRARGIPAFGIEGSEHGIAYAHPSVRDCIELADITTRQNLGPASLVVCTEVAEHLDEKHAPGLVELLCSAMAPIVFTAAPPGQDGHHHVHLREAGYWIAMFQARGCYYDAAATQELKLRWSHLKRLSYMAKNVMVIR